MKALITGASRGIGRACAEAFSAAGYQVSGLYLSSGEAAENLADGTGCRVIRADVADAEAIRSLPGDVLDTDVLLCCAGVSLSGLVTDLTDGEIRRLFDVNFFGTLHCIRAVVPHMVRRKSGVILTVSSMWGQVGASCESVYSASKATVIGLTKSLAKELGPSGIRVCCIAPGVIDTDMNASLSAEELEALRLDTPLERIGTPEDIAETALFLASDRARFITGQVIGVSGGFVI